MIDFSSTRTSRRFASPRARRAMRQRGFDIAQIAGSGPNDRIVEADVLRFAPPANLEAARNVFTLRAQADASALQDLLNRHQTAPRDFLERAVAIAMKNHAPEANLVCEVGVSQSRRAVEYYPALPAGAHGAFGLGAGVLPQWSLCFCGDAAHQDVLETVFDAVVEIIEEPMLLLFG